MASKGRNMYYKNKKQETTEIEIAESVQAVEGKSIELVCNVTPPVYDKIYMIFLFKGDAGIPLYSFDVRGKALVQAQPTSASEMFGNRAHFRVNPHPPTFFVKEIRRHDQGMYRCRVDFKETPTRSIRYNLTVIVPPEYPTVFDKWGRQLNTSIGPLDEGDEISLTCRVIGGEPEPRVRWLVNGVKVDEEYEHNSGDVIENRLNWRPVTRKDLNSIFSCQASNTDLTDPRETSVVLQLYLRPLVVNIVNKPARLVADQRYEVTCESAGSRPPAVITWYKGKRLLRKVKDDTREHANLTTSVLSFVPNTEDDGKAITCRAENPNVTGLFVDTNWNIEVVFPPIVSLRLGSTLNASDIKEGDDVYFECHIKANPPWRKLTWLHNGELLNHNMSARLILINQSLVLQKVTRQSAGRYACVAVNQEGETTSKEFNLRVKYSPTCKHERVVVVGASRAESLDIYCEVDADPPARSFRWKFNNSGETLEVGPERYTSNGTTSLLRYTPVADLDYGTLSCWAENAIAPQVVPCLFQVVAAGKPYPVRNCSLSNQTSSSVQVWCQPGSDGGLPQVFILELYSGPTSQLRYNMTGSEPYFLLTDLEPDVTFRIAVLAVNSKGRSPAFVLEEVTFRDPEKRTGEEGDLGIPPVLGIVAGAGLTLVVLALLGAGKLRMAGRRANKRQPLQPQPDKSHRVDKEPDEKDPDIIPAKYEPAFRALLGNGDITYEKVEEPNWTAPDSIQRRREDDPACGEGAGYVRELWRIDGELAPDLELNGNAIKERLMRSRLPESCV